MNPPTQLTYLTRQANESDSARIDAQTNQVQLRVVAESGPLFHLGPIRVEGLQKHNAASVLNLATFSPGTPYSERLLLDYQERLQKSDLFEGSSVEIEPDPTNAAAGTAHLIRVAHARDPVELLRAVHFDLRRDRRRQFQQPVGFLRVILQREIDDADFRDRRRRARPGVHDGELAGDGGQAGECRDDLRR